MFLVFPGIWYLVVFHQLRPVSLPLLKKSSIIRSDHLFLHIHPQHDFVANFRWDFLWQSFSIDLFSWCAFTKNRFLEIVASRCPVNSFWHNYFIIITFDYMSILFNFNSTWLSTFCLWKKNHQLKRLPFLLFFSFIVESHCLKKSTISGVMYKHFTVTMALFNILKGIWPPWLEV